MKNNEIKTKNKSFNQKVFLALIKGTVIAYLITFAVFIIYALLLTYTDITEKNINTISLITSVVSVLISSFIVCRASQKNGLLYGMLTGFLYAFIMLMLNLCIMPSITFSYKMLMLIIACIASGGISGIIYINLKK